MIVRLLTEHHLEFPSLKRGCTGSSESTHVKSGSSPMTGKKGLQGGLQETTNIHL